MDELVVAVTGAGSLVGQGIIRSLRMSPLSLTLCGFDYFDTAVGLRWCDHRELLPDLLDERVHEDEWFDALGNMLSRHEIRYLFVGADFELDPIARRLDMLEEEYRCTAIVSRPELIAACQDKYETPRLLRSLGFPAPQTWLPEELPATPTLPLIVKPRRGWRSRGVTVAKTEAELTRAMEEVDQPIVQQFLPPDPGEFTCGVCALEGTVLDVAVLRRTLRDGNTVTAYYEGYPVIEAFCAEAARRLAPMGPLNLQLRLADSRPMVFEINPRFSGTTIFRAHLGINEPERLLRALRGEDLPPAQLRHGRILRHFTEIVEYANDLE